MKKLLIAVAVLVVLLLAAVVVVPQLIPVETYKNQITAQVRAATGRELIIGGDMNVSVIPKVAVSMEKVTFANAPGARSAEMVTLGSLDVELAIWPLLSGEVVVDRFVLIEPVINLEVDRQGRPNWQFAEAGTGQPAAGGGAGQGGGDGTTSLSDLRLGDIRLVDGLVTYFDARTGAEQRVSGIDMTLRLPDLDSAFSAEGDFVWNDEEIALKLGADKPRALMTNGTTGVTAELSAAPVQFRFGGDVTAGAAPEVAGKIDLSVPSVRGLAAWTGSPLPEGGGLEPLAIRGTLAAEGQKVTFSDAEIEIDAIKSKGELFVDASGARPFLKGRLDVEMLDVNPYLPAPQEGTPASGAGGGSGQPSAQAGWSREPIDLSGLKAVDADFTLTTGGIKVQKIEIGKSALTVRLKGGRLVADLTEMALYDGQGTATVVVDGSGSVPAIEHRLNISGVQAQPLLNAAADFGRLSGTVNADVGVTARGASQAALIAASQGKGAVKFADGAIEGINLAGMVRNVQSAFLDPSARETQKTDFSELSGTFTIANGILKNDDLQMLSPLLRITGAGTVDLPQRTVDYRVEPKAVASLTGQGGREDLGGVMVPVIIEGPWDNIGYKPDLAGILKQQIDPGKALEQLKEGGVEGLKGLIPGGSGSSDGTSGTGASGGTAPSPADALKGLFGR